MKRLSAFALMIFFIFGLTAFSGVSADPGTSTSRLMNDKPGIFNAYGFRYSDDGEEPPPFHNLQNQMEFQFIDQKTVVRELTAEYTEESAYGPSVHILGLNLKYDRTLLEPGENFITGTFTYRWDHGGMVTDYSGTINGKLVEISTEIMEFAADYEYTNAIALDLEVSGGDWEWIIYLEVPDEELYYMGSLINENAGTEAASHVPSPDTQADVAAGVGVSAVGIAVANALTKTTVMGGVSLTPPVGLPVPSSAAADLTQPVMESGNGFFKALFRFFSNIFESLRDMITDEGRSYASGRLSETFGSDGMIAGLDDSGDGGSSGGYGGGDAGGDGGGD